MDTVSTSHSDSLTENAVAIEVPSHQGLPLRDTALSRMLDRVVYVVGEVFHWIWIALLAVIIINVILRYVFSRGMIELEELQWYLYAVGWLIGLSYTFISDDHVRVDVLHEKLSYRGKLWFEMGGCCCSSCRSSCSSSSMPFHSSSCHGRRTSARLRRTVCPRGGW